MLTLYQSNQLDLLKNLITTIMTKQPLPHVFDKEVILVQSQGMGQWLQMAIANDIGIAANIAFPFPNQFIWNIYRQFNLKLPEENLFSVDYMVWMIFDLLPNLIDEPDFAPVKNYIFSHADDKNQHITQEKKYFQLSRHIANLFDQYLVYRPDWITSWEQGKAVPLLGSDQNWQAALFKALINHTTNELPQALKSDMHRTKIHQHVIDLLAKDELPKAIKQRLPARIFIFGIISLPPSYLELISALSRHIDVHLMFMNPCKEYWLDNITNKMMEQTVTDLPLNQMQVNTLLTSWGKLGRDYAFLLQDHHKKEIDAFVSLDDKPKTLLNIVKQSILENKHSLQEDQPKSRILPDDKSISVHVCHSELREVEILYDHLLDLFEHNSIELNDVVVMMPDVEAYAPYIKAVFDNAPAHRSLPYTISDQSLLHIDPIIDGFLMLLTLPQNRIEVDFIFELLDITAIANKFNLSTQNMPLLKQWIVDAGIRFGLESNADEPHSFGIGIKRMLLGYMMDSELDTWQGILPYPHTIGLEAEKVGLLADFIDVIIQWKNRLSQKHDAKTWQTLCDKLIDDFFAQDEHNEVVILTIKNHWQKVLNNALYVGFSAQISINILQELITSSFNDNVLTHRFLGGKINFCGMIPMRSVPFKVVCLLGMNDGAYPRVHTPFGFDLLQKHAKIGDRNKRNDDRYLFLEALLSAEDYLYISYVGFDIKSNEVKYPSVLVDELTDYLKETTALSNNKDADVQQKEVLNQVIKTHHRVPFSWKNYTASETSLVSYADEWLVDQTKEPKPFITKLPQISTNKLTIDELKRFYIHTIGYFTQVRLGVYFNHTHEETHNNEIFTLDGLARYEANNDIFDLMQRYQDDKIIDEALYNRLLKSGKLPYGGFGQLEFHERKQQITSFLGIIKDYTQAEFSSKSVDIITQNCHLTGVIERLYHQQILRYRCANYKIRDAITLWIDHLCHNLTHSSKSTMYFLDKYIELNELTADEAKNHLDELVLGYQKGINEPLFMPLVSSYEMIEKTQKADKSDENKLKQIAFKAFNSKWNDSFNQFSGENDAYYTRFYPEITDDLKSEALNYANCYLLPLFLSISCNKY